MTRYKEAGEQKAEISSPGTVGRIRREEPGECEIKAGHPPVRSHATPKTLIQK